MAEVDCKENINEELEIKNNSEFVEFVLVFQNNRFQIKFDLDKTILEFKDHVQTLTEIPPNMQKIMFKGLAKDELTLRALNIKNGDKLMLIGSKPQDVEQVKKKPILTQNKTTASSSIVKKEPLCNENPHKKIIEKYGKPEDCMPGILNIKEPLPEAPLYGMLNSQGHKVRLTFKLESDQLWISTKDRTEKIPLPLKTVINEPIVGHEEYHLMGIQFGSTEASRYWIYWVPAQYVDAIKNALA